jgi:hypothetical protein
MNDNLMQDPTYLDRFTYVGAPIHDGSSQRDVRDALIAAHTHPVPAVRTILVRALTAQIVVGA